MECVTLDIGMTFQPVEDELRDAFLPDLFKGYTSQIPGRAVNGLTFKQDGIYLPDPTYTSGSNCMMSCVIT